MKNAGRSYEVREQLYTKMRLFVMLKLILLTTGMCCLWHFSSLPPQPGGLWVAYPWSVMPSGNFPRQPREVISQQLLAKPFNWQLSLVL